MYGEHKNVLTMPQPLPVYCFCSLNVVAAATFSMSSSFFSVVDLSGIILGLQRTSRKVSNSEYNTPCLGSTLSTELVRFQRLHS